MGPFDNFSLSDITPEALFDNLLGEYGAGLKNDIADPNLGQEAKDEAKKKLNDLKEAGMNTMKTKVDEFKSLLSSIPKGIAGTIAAAQGIAVSLPTTIAQLAIIDPLAPVSSGAIISGAAAKLNEINGTIKDLKGSADSLKSQITQLKNIVSQLQLTNVPAVKTAVDGIDNSVSGMDAAISAIPSFDIPEIPEIPKPEK